MTDTYLESPSAWFIQQLQLKSSKPIRLFYMNGEDHSDKVTAWPTIRRKTEIIKPVNVKIKLSNIDGEYNDFWTSLYTMNISGTLYLAYAYDNGDREILTVYTGQLQKVEYSNTSCTVYVKDKFFDFSSRKIGSTENFVDFSQQIPSDIVWTLCTCYTGLSAVQSTSNPDINYSAFLNWAETFSRDLFTVQCHCQGKNIFTILSEIMEYTDSYNYVDHNGRIVFSRFDEVSSLDFVVNALNWKTCKLDVDAEGLINKQYVSWDYNVSSDAWEYQASFVNTSSVNSYSLRERVLEYDSVWAVNSTDAFNIATRKVFRYSDPTKHFEIELPLTGLNRTLGESVRLINSFFSVTSETAWRITEHAFNMRDLSTKIKTSYALTVSRFYLDSSLLDSDDRLL